MSYEGIRIREGLDRSVQRAVGITPRRHETLGELVRDVAAQRGVRRREDLAWEQPTRHEVRADGQIFHTHCFVDALMLHSCSRKQGSRYAPRTRAEKRSGRS